MQAVADVSHECHPFDKIREANEIKSEIKEEYLKLINKFYDHLKEMLMFVFLFIRNRKKHRL